MRVWMRQLRFGRLRVWSRGDDGYRLRGKGTINVLEIIEMSVNEATAFRMGIFQSRVSVFGWRDDFLACYMLGARILSRGTSVGVLTLILRCI